MDSREIKLIISNSSPFNKLKERQLNKLLALSEVKEYRNGEDIYKEKDRPDYLYLLLKGRVMVLAEAEARDREIEIIKRGTCFGIISLLTEDPHSVTARSIETSFILQIERNKFKEFLRKNPVLSLDFSRLLSQRVKVRHKPKKIFQSKRIGIMGDKCVGKSTYMLNLGLELVRQTKKALICIQIAPAPGNSINSFEDNPRYNKDKVLALKAFQEDSFSDYLIKDNNIDYLYLKADSADKFMSLLNFLSESYHFVLYEIPHSFLQLRLDGSISLTTSEFINPAHQVHFIVFPEQQTLKEAGFLIKRLRETDLFNEEKIKVILALFSEQDNLPYSKKTKLLNCPIYATLPREQDESYSCALRRIAREIGEVTLGLALGSGAAYGFSHIGVLKVLEANNVYIDIICGSSIGALIAALWAAGFSISEIERKAGEFGRKISSFSIMGFSFPFRGIMRARRLENISKDIFGNLAFYDLKHTLKIVVFDFRRRKTVILKEGPLYKAVAASCAFPGIFEPIKFGKSIFLDGGILNPLPTKTLLNFNTHKIVASNITPSTEQTLRKYKKRSRFHIFDFIFGSIETMQQQFIQQAIRIADVVIHPDLEDLGWMEFDKISEFIERGKKAAEDKIDEIKELVSF